MVIRTDLDWTIETFCHWFVILLELLAKVSCQLARINYLF